MVDGLNSKLSNIILMGNSWPLKIYMIQNSTISWLMKNIFMTYEIKTLMKTFSRAIKTFEHEFSWLSFMGSAHSTSFSRKIYGPWKYQLSLSWVMKDIYLIILVPIALFAPLRRQGLGMRIEGLWRHRTSGLHVCSRNVATYCMGLLMVAVEPGFMESLCQTLSGIS